MEQTLAIVRKAVGKRKERLPPAQAAIPWTAGTKRKQQRRGELREAREMAEQLVAESKAADLRSAEAERIAEREALQAEVSAGRAAQRAEYEKHGGLHGPRLV